MRVCRGLAGTLNNQTTKEDGIGSLGYNKRSICKI
jgi:hypothetical protein